MSTKRLITVSYELPDNLKVAGDGHTHYEFPLVNVAVINVKSKSELVEMLLNAYIMASDDFIAQHPLECQSCLAYVSHVKMRKYCRDVLAGVEKIIT